MPFVNNSINMNLPIPQVGVDPGPQWATDVNNCLTLIDQHNHTPGYGIAVPPAGLNINADLTIQGNNLINIRSDRYLLNVSPLAGASDLACVYVAGADLYYNDTAGNQVRLTAAGSVNATSSGISSGTASASFSAGTLVVNQNTNTPGNIEAGSILLGNNVASSPYLTLSPPTLSGGYTITLPSLPGSLLPLSIDNVGNMSAAQITMAQLVSAVQQALNPSGSILAYGGASAPTGYLLCDGTPYSRTTYASLFSAIGTAYGNGDGSTTFNVPDLRGQFLRGVTGASANDPDAASRTANNSGGNTANNVGSEQGYQVQSHLHSIPNIFLGGGGVSNTVQGNPTNPSLPLSQNTGGTGGNETRPINVYVTFVIKT